MKDYTAIVKHENSLSVCFYIEQEKILAIGEKMNEINEEAYMNSIVEPIQKQVERASLKD